MYAQTRTIVIEGGGGGAEKRKIGKSYENPNSLEKGPAQYNVPLV